MCVFWGAQVQHRHRVVQGLGHLHSWAPAAPLGGHSCSSVCELRSIPSPRSPGQGESREGRAGMSYRHQLCHSHSPRGAWGLHFALSPAGVLKLPGKPVPVQLSLCPCSSEGLQSAQRSGNGGAHGPSPKESRALWELHPVQPNPGSGSSPTCQPR